MMGLPGGKEVQHADFFLHPLDLKRGAGQYLIYELSG